MVDTTNMSLNFKVVTGRARSAAKALSIVAGVLSQSRTEQAADSTTVTLHLEEDQLDAFNFLVDNVMSLTSEAAELADALVRSTKVDAPTATAGGTKRRAGEVDDTALALKRDT